MTDEYTPDKKKTDDFAPDQDALQDALKDSETLPIDRVNDPSSPDIFASPGVPQPQDTSIAPDDLHDPAQEPKIDFDSISLDDEENDAIKETTADPAATPAPPAAVANADKGEENHYGKGESVEITRKYPTLQNITIAAGWDQRAFEEEMIDIDLSLFLLDKNEKTRFDEDFIFYNATQDPNGAVKHLGDSRTGAGEGDDESIEIDLNGLSYNITKIMVVLSVYDPEMEGKNFSMVKNMFIRILNNDDDNEIIRFIIDNDEIEQSKGTGMHGLVLVREGPKWICETISDITEGGLAKIATDYDIIVREMQSSGA